MKTKVSYSSCRIHVEGMELQCPFCQVVVKSGETHECAEPDATIEAKVVKRKRVANPEEGQKV